MQLNGSGLVCLHASGGCNCAVAPAAAATSQSLDELQFMRSACAAAQAGNVERLRAIITRDPTCVSDDGVRGGSGYTPLHYAARAGHAAAVALLLKHGADVAAVTRSGRATALHRAAAAGHLEVVKLLLDAGADGMAQDADGEVPLHKAATGRHDAVAQCLAAAFPQASRVADRKGRLPCQQQ